MGIIFFILDLLNPRVKKQGRIADAAVDVATRRMGVFGEVIGYFARKGINKRFHS